MARRDTTTGGRAATDAVIPGIAALSIGRPTTLPQPVGFRWTPLSAVSRLESGHTPSRAKPEYWNGDIPWVGIRDATANHGRIISNTEQHVTQLGIDNSSARVLPAGTVCLSRTASVGYVIQAARPMATSQDFVNWICGAELLPDYLRYLLVSEGDSVRRFAYGSVHPTMYYPDAKALHVLIPSVKEQEKVVEVLGSLDDKIAANAATAAIAWSLAEAEFQAVQNTEPLAPSHLRDIATLEYGKSLPASSRVPGTVAVVGSGGVSGSHNESIVPESGVVIGRKGSAGAVHWVSGPHFPIDTTFYARGSSDEISQPFLYFVLRGLRLDQMNNDSAVPGLNRSDALSLPVAVPSPEYLRTFTHRASELIELSEGLSRENQTLAAVRDALLPQLMSGKLRVRDIDFPV